MKTIEAIKTHSLDVRVTNGNKWLVFDMFTHEWEVYQKFYRHPVVKLLSTPSEEDAVAQLLKP